MTIWEYIFIGAGPATLAAVTNLPLTKRKNSIILEAGAGQSRRICPEIRSASCSSCFGEECHVLNGVGGASAIFGNKICHFPASNKVLNLVNSSFKNSALASPSVSFEDLDRINEHEENNITTHPGSKNRKMYRSDILYMGEYKKKIVNLLSEVQSTTKIHTNTQVLKIHKNNDSTFRLITRDGETFYTKNLVIATGRSGHKELRNWLSQLEIEYEDNLVDTGIRIEVNSNLIAPGFLYQTDPKYKFNFGNLGTARTFCTCKGGSIIPVKYGKSFFADGAFFRKDTNRTNIALMVRSSSYLSNKDIEHWCNTINKTSNNGLLLGEFNMSNLDHKQIAKKLLEFVPDGPTRPHTVMMDKLIHKVIGGEFVEMISKSLPNKANMKIFGPTIDQYWPRPTLYEGFQTTQKGVDIIGDATGVSRGIFQALVSGTAWAMHNTHINEDYFTQQLVSSGEKQN